MDGTEAQAPAAVAAFEGRAAVGALDEGAAGARVRALSPTRSRAGPCRWAKSCGRSFRKPLQGCCLAGSCLFKLSQGIWAVVQYKSENRKLATLDSGNRRRPCPCRR